MRRPKRILYIEDKIEMISLTRIFLRRQGFEVLGAVNGSKGLETVKREKPDLILLDLLMPGMSGWEVHQQLQADDDLAQIPIIFITASAQTEETVVALQQSKGVVDYLTKPFAPRALVESIKRVFAQTVC